jgi:hypothetical protein
MKNEKNLELIANTRIKSKNFETINYVSLPDML